jgi:cytochrome c-type biogenesis protein CcmH
VTRLLVLALLLVACDKHAEAPPARGREAVRGLPAAGEGPAAPGAGPVAPGAADPTHALPPGHPALPASGPGLASAPPAAAAAPPPAAAADGSDVIEGQIDVAPALRDSVHVGDTLFVSAKAVDASGAVQRMPLAVDRLVVGKLPMAFRLTGANVMVPGSTLSGTVRVTARVDKDGEAMTRAAGDVEGAAQVTVPARGVQIKLDTPVAP